MTTRQEKFEQERQKMLEQMGADDGHIDIEEEIETEVPMQEDPYANDPDMQAVRDEIWEDYEEEANARLNALDERLERIQEDPDYFQREENKDSANERRIATKGCPDAVGPVTGILYDFLNKRGGGSFMWLVTIFFIMPYSYSCFSGMEGRNLTSRLVSSALVFVCAWGMLRMITLTLSFIFQDVALGMLSKTCGPKFLLDVRKGKNGRKFDILTPLMSLIANHMFLFISMLTLVLIMAMGTVGYGSPWGFFTRESGKTILQVWLIVSVVSLCVWVIIYGIGYGIYSALAKNTVNQNKDMIYRLRYLHSPSRVMIAPRKSKGRFVSNEERLQATLEAGG
jgi:hypothetical protein